MVYSSSKQTQQSASEKREYSATVPNSASVPNSATVPNLDDARGHKAITESEKPLQPEFNQSKAKTNDNCSKLSASDLHESKLYIGQ